MKFKNGSLVKNYIFWPTLEVFKSLKINFDNFDPLKFSSMPRFGFWSGSYMVEDDTNFQRQCLGKSSSFEDNANNKCNFLNKKTYDDLKENTTFIY